MAETIIITRTVASSGRLMQPGDREEASTSMAEYRVQNGQGMQDFTSIDGVGIATALNLAKHGIRTFDGLKNAEPEQLERLGLGKTERDSIDAWREPPKPKRKASKAKRRKTKTNKEAATREDKSA